MTMIDHPFSHQNLDNSKQQQYYYSLLFGTCDDGMSRLEGYECNYSKSFLVTESSTDINNIIEAAGNFVDFPMADHHDDHREEEESRTAESYLNEPAAGSTSKDFEQDGGSWLKLGLGRHVTSKPRDRPNVEVPTSSSVTRPAGLLELTLLPAGTTTTTTTTGSQSQPSTVVMMSPPNLNPSNNSLMFQQPQSSTMGVNYYSGAPRHPQDLNFVFRPTHDIPFRNFQSLAASNYNFPPTSGGSNYFTTPFQQLRPTAAATRDVAAGPSFDFRVISPPRRPHSGLWFILQASQTQSKEPFLPQIPKSYLRIKDGRMTVRMLMKYLVNKLKLGSESEVEIRCRGQQLVPFLTLQYVRDNIWRSKDMPPTEPSSSSSSLLPPSSSSSSSPATNITTDHLMLLHYSRTSIITTS